MKLSKVLVTGAAGFIGYHLVSKLIDEDFDVFGLDNLSDYYEVDLKIARLKNHGINEEVLLDQVIYSSREFNNYKFIRADIEDFDFIVNFMKFNCFDFVINLAAQAGVRYSIENPGIYVKSNVSGFLSILEGCRQTNPTHLIYASTSSVYGLNTKMPLNESMPTEHPMSLYAATKKANEMMAHSYSHLFRIPSTGLRFFTVYGPWGRPDMALFLFTKAMLRGEPIKLFNKGIMFRDFTYVDDIVNSIYKLMPNSPKPDPKWDGDYPNISSSTCPYQILNIGNSTPVNLIDYVKEIEKALGIKAKYQYTPMQAGDVHGTHADTSKLQKIINFKPSTTVQDGVKEFVKWYKEYYQ